MQSCSTTNHDGIDRRGFLKCMAWAGTGALCVLQAECLKSYGLDDPRAHRKGGPRRTQLRSDQRQPHGLQQAGEHRCGRDAAGRGRQDQRAGRAAGIHAAHRRHQPSLQTGRVRYVDQILKSAPTKDVFFVPGEHDVLEDNGKQYLERYGKNTRGAGWYSFDKKGVHFVGLVNVMNLKAGGMGSLGRGTTGVAGRRRQSISPKARL